MLTKRLVFAPLFLTAFAVACYQINSLLNSSALIFSLSIDGFIEIVLTVSLLLLSSLLFIIFATLARSWVIIGVISLLAAILPIFFLNSPINYIFGSGALVSFLLINVLLTHTLKTYLSFQPSKIFTSPTKNLARLLVLLIAVCFYIQMNAVIKEKGFQIPDEILDPVISTLSNQMVLGESIAQAPAIPNLTQEQIEMLRNNPDLLKQYGVDPKLFDSLYPPTSSQKTTTTSPQSSTKPTPSSSPNPSSSSKPATGTISSPKPETTSTSPIVASQNNFIKTLVKSQIESSLKPYEKYIAPTLAVLSFFALTSMVSLLSVFVGPLAAVIFMILEKIKFISFTQEMHPVKKIVV